MRRISVIIGVFAAAITLAGCSSTLDLLEQPAPKSESTAPAESLHDSWLEGEVLVGFNSEGALSQIVNQLGGRVTERLDAINTAVVALPPSLSVREAVSTLVRAKPDGMRYIEPNYIREHIAPMPGGYPTGDSVTASEPVAPEGVARPAQAAYTDPERHRQWAIDIMNVEAAWNIATGQGTIIGVVDTGMDGTHPDLIGKQVTGMDCLTGDLIPPDVDGTMGVNTHATHVAGIAAAWGNNGEGIVGVAPEAKVMSLIIFNPLLAGPGNGSGYVGDANVARCIVYASVYGPDGVPHSGDEANVLNNSWGGKSYGQTLTDAINLAVESGTVFVVSKGNSGEDEMRDPERLPGTIAVGATMAKDLKTDFSTMGPNISVGAPGENVLSSVPTWLMRPDGTPYMYQYFNGTSMAAPQVSGLVALLFEKFPDATPYQIQKIIETTSDDIEARGYDRNTGWGRINAGRALSAASLPADGSTVVVSVVTGNPGDNGQPVGLPAVDVILRQGGMDRYFAQTNAQGQARFFNVPVGAYNVITAGGDTLLYNFRPANRVAATGIVSAVGGEVSETTVTLSTSMTVSITWDGNEDVDLVVGEPGPDGDLQWMSEKTDLPNWGALSFSTSPVGGNNETYTLDADHYPYALYPIAISAENVGGPVNVSVTVTQNGVIETYGPFALQPGEVLQSNEWYDWWENTPDPEKGFAQPGPGAPWIY